MSNEICKELEIIIDNLLTEIEDSLPSDSLIKFTIFTETLRVLDLHSIATNTDEITNSIIKMWWSLSTSFLFSGINAWGFPFSESTEQSFKYAFNLLYKLWTIVMLNRVIDMVKANVVLIKKENNKFIFEKNKNIDINSQHLDRLMWIEYFELKEELKDEKNKYFNQWERIDKENLEDFSNKEWMFYISCDFDYSKFYANNIEKSLLKQISPWDSWKGIMIKYDSTPEIDKHYSLKALEIVNNWCEEAWFHDKLKIWNINGWDIKLVILSITSFHLKHTQSTLLAHKKYPEVLVRQTLTLFTKIEELINSISMFYNIDKKIITEALNAITLRPEDLNLLKKSTSKFIPLLIDSGNGFLLRPISSMEENPFFSVIDILTHRNPKFINDISSFREEWLRNNLYSIFAGNKYYNIDWNIKLKSLNNVCTDIDAVIFDRVTGNLALFQIKWQDYHFNDVRKLRSRACNLAEKLDSWALKVDNWIEENWLLKLAQSIKLNLKKEKSINKVYLFWISKNVIKTKWYWYSIKNKNLAVSNWAQFNLNRFKLWGSENIFDDMFHVLKNQEYNTIKIKNISHEFSINNNKFLFKDIFGIKE